MYEMYLGLIKSTMLSSLSIFSKSGTPFTLYGKDIISTKPTEIEIERINVNVVCFS